MEALFILLLVPAVVIAGSAGIVWLLWKLVRGLVRGLARLLSPVLRGTGALLGHVLSTLWNMVRDLLHAVGALVTAVVVLPLILGNLSLGRTRSAGHYSRACGDELSGCLLGLYRVAISHPLRLVGLGPVLEGLERRLPATIDREPVAPRGKLGEFPGYRVLSALPTGGSGADVLLAEPRRETRARWAEVGREIPGRVVIKSFELQRGSSLPQIVRESRALEAAGRLGLVYDHELAEERFWYVMEYVEGEELGLAVQHMHDRGGAAGLGETGVRRVLWWSRSLLGTLERFHGGGLWHKDVKPSNIIVNGARLNLVDFGLVTPLASTMTLTTHGTEFFRDPELVRLALQGVKVHEVDGVKFDLFSAGAVIYSMLENSFPAQGSLSRFSKPAPEALQWIVRRAMAEIDQRYGSAGEMLLDLEALDAAEDPWAVLPAELPSIRTPFAQRAHTPEPAPAAWTPPVRRPAAQARPATRSAGQRRRRRAVAAAGVMGLAAFGAVGLTALVAEAHGRERQSMRVHETVRTPRLEPAELEAWELAHDVLDAVGFERPAAQDLVRASAPPSSAGDALATRGPSRPSPQLAQRLDGRALVILSDVGAPVPREAMSEFEARLAEGGLELLSTTRGELTPEEEATIAAAHHVAGLDGLGDRDARGRLQDWLLQHPELGGILWVAGTDDPERFRYTVLTRPEPEQEAQPDATTSSSPRWRLLDAEAGRVRAGLRTRCEATAGATALSDSI